MKIVAQKMMKFKKSRKMKNRIIHRLNLAAFLSMVKVEDMNEIRKVVLY